MKADTSTHSKLTPNNLFSSLILRWTGLVGYSYTPPAAKQLNLVKNDSWTLVAEGCSARLSVGANQRWQAAGLNLTSARLTHLMSHPDSEVHVLHGNSSPSSQQFPAQRVHRQQCRIWHHLLSTLLLHGKAARFEILFSFVILCNRYLSSAIIIDSFLKVTGMTDTFSSNKDALELYLKNCVSRNAEKMRIKVALWYF